MFDSISHILGDLSKIAGIRNVLVIDKDGLLIAQGSSLPAKNKDTFEDLASLFARAIHSFEPSLKATNIDHSGIKQLIIERENNEKLIIFVAKDFILAVTTQDTINLGLVRMEMHDTLLKLTPLLESVS